MVAGAAAHLEAPSWRPRSSRSRKESNEQLLQHDCSKHTTCATVFWSTEANVGVRLFGGRRHERGKKHDDCDRRRTAERHVTRAKHSLVVDRWTSIDPAFSCCDDGDRLLRHPAVRDVLSLYTWVVPGPEKLGLPLPLCPPGRGGMSTGADSAVDLSYRHHLPDIWVPRGPSLLPAAWNVSVI